MGGSRAGAASPRVVARGFASDKADLIVFDERMEPALEDLHAHIYLKVTNKF